MTAQNVERVRAINLIKKLQAHSIGNGSSESEAEKALEKTAELMETFDVTLDEVTIEQENCKQVEFNTGRGRNYSSHCVGLAKLTDTLVFRNHDEHGNHVHVFFGFEQDVDMVQYLYEVIEKTLEESYEDFKQTDIYQQNSGAEKRVATNSFKRSYYDRIYERAIKLKAERERKRSARDQEIKEPLVKTGKELIVLKDNKVQREFKEKYGFKVRYTSTARNHQNNYGAAYAGSSAGDKVNLNRPVGGHSGQKRIGYGG